MENTRYCLKYPHKRLLQLKALCLYSGLQRRVTALLRTRRGLRFVQGDIDRRMFLICNR